MGSCSGSAGPSGGLVELLGGVAVLAGGVEPCGIPDEQVSEIFCTSVTFRDDWPLEFELVAELPELPVICTSLLRLSFSLEVSPVS